MLHIAFGRREALLHKFEGNKALVWSESEQARLDDYTTKVQRQRLIAGHGLARRVLLDHLGGHIGDWRLNGLAGEPPSVADHPDLYLSLTHSGEWYACAISSAPVGIDIEILKPRRDWIGLVEIVGTREECAQLLMLDENEQALRFLELWTLKEAWLKQWGQGLDIERMRRLQIVSADRQVAHALSWFDTGAALTIALTSAYADTAQVNWPDELHPNAMKRWIFKAD